MINFQSGFIKTKTTKGNEYIASDNIGAISSDNYGTVLISLKNPIFDQDSGKNSISITRKGNLSEWLKALKYTQKTENIAEVNTSQIDILG